MYEASTAGRIRSFYRGERRVLKTQPNKKGYLHIGLQINGRRHCEMVHSIIARTFIGPRPDGLEVNHKNTVKSDNSLSNLEYVTHQENINHYQAAGIKSGSFKGSTNNFAKLTEPDVRNIRERLAMGEKMKSLAEHFRVTYETILSIKNRRSWVHI